MESIVGKQFGELLVLGQFTRRFASATISMSRVRCSCGTEKELQTTLLTSRKWTTCRVGKHDQNLIDLTGQEFGYLTAVEYLPAIKKWKCHCVCGKEHCVRANSLKAFKTKSCGCMAFASRKAKPNNHRIKNAIFKGYKGAASRRGYCFTLSFENFSELIQQTCHYCGSPPATLWKEEVGRGNLKNPVRDFYYNGVDRVDNSEGYIPQNCVPCCSICNRAKATLSLDEWLRWIEKVYAFQNMQGKFNDQSYDVGSSEPKWREPSKRGF